MVNGPGELHKAPRLASFLTARSHMNRRSVLRWLGLAPVAAPAAVVAASAPALPPVDYSGLTDGVRRTQTRVLQAEENIAALAEANCGLTHPFSFDGETLRVPSQVVPRAAS